MSDDYDISFHRDENGCPAIDFDHWCKIWIVWKMDPIESRALAKLNREADRYNAKYPEVKEIFAICLSEERAKQYLKYLVSPDWRGEEPECYDFYEYVHSKKMHPRDKKAAFIEESRANHMLGYTCVQMLKDMHDADNKDE